MPKAQFRIGENERRFFSSTTTCAAGNFFSEQRERLARSPAELIDRLIRIAHGKDVRFWSGEYGENFDLGKVRVLKFIDQNEAGAARSSSSNAGSSFSN